MTPLENWIKRKISLLETDRLTLDHLRNYQLLKLKEVLAYTRAQSPFYRRLLGQESPLQDLEEIISLPFTTADDLCDHHVEFLCVSQSDVARVTTLQTWETRPKQLYFTDSDLELTVDFFHHGMSGIVEPGQRVLILMPGERPGSVGDLLVKALARMDVQGIVHGPVQDPARTIDEITAKRIDSLVGIPTHVLSLVRLPESSGIPAGRIKSVLLSSDYVPQAIVDEVTEAWQCPVYEHYGMTEMGLGGGVHCSAHEGYHLREADLFLEIIDPETGRQEREGEIGEIVFTTLTRKAMPLIRYRTGDLARFIPGTCPCGTVLRRMDKIRGRIKGVVMLAKDHELDVSDLDNVVFTVDGLLDYQAEIYREGKKDHLRVMIRSVAESPKEVSARVQEVLSRVPLIRRAIEEDVLVLDPVITDKRDRISPTMSKRKIRDLRL